MRLGCTAQIIDDNGDYGLAEVRSYKFLPLFLAHGNAIALQSLFADANWKRIDGLTTRENRTHGASSISSLASTLTIHPGV